ncbi:MAG TPA: cysteine dioxygenase family protein [Burkholderiales bacterium]|jgi:predicted metal-dependent enzyme (double-stranded beta helix superfamily)|nr:cysteine dioxygenase family protein [Burkholderiales bacterium]
MKPHELVAKFAAAASLGEPMPAARAALEELKDHIAEVGEALRYISGVGGNARQVFYRSPELTLLKVCFPAGRRTPPHDHGTWATILLLSGEEKNTLYRVEDGRLRKASEVTIKSGSILGIRADAAHVVECVGNAPTIGLHVYGGDIFELPRRMWHPQTLEEHRLDWTLYENFARIASEAPAAPAP